MDSDFSEINKWIKSSYCEDNIIINYDYKASINDIYSNKMGRAEDLLDGRSYIMNKEEEKKLLFKKDKIW